jgi:hypothetical protein
VRQPDGSTKQNGPVVRMKGDKYLVDCAVTGSNPGTADDPKFPLIDVFREYVFPKVSALVAVGGSMKDTLQSFKVTTLVRIRRSSM